MTGHRRRARTSRRAGGPRADIIVGRWAQIGYRHGVRIGGRSSRVPTPRALGRRRGRPRWRPVSDGIAGVALTASALAVVPATAAGDTRYPLTQTQSAQATFRIAGCGDTATR